jgi:hypothetical protein
LAGNLKAVSDKKRFFSSLNIKLEASVLCLVFIAFPGFPDEYKNWVGKFISHAYFWQIKK